MGLAYAWRAEEDHILRLRLSGFFLSLSIVNSVIQHLVVSGQIGGFQGEIYYFTLFQQNIFCIHRLLQRKHRLTMVNTPLNKTLG